MVQNIHGRRYPVVDRERGVVWSQVVFDQGIVNKGILSDGRPCEFKGFNRPSSILVTEAFLMKNPPRGDGRHYRGVSHEFPVAWRAEWELKDNT